MSMITLEGKIVERNSRERKLTCSLLNLNPSNFARGRFDYVDNKKIEDYLLEGKKVKTVYTDRMYEWDYKKYDDSCMKVWGNEGQYFSQRAKEPNKVSEFLSLYNEKECEVVCIFTSTNASTGYPVTCIFYVEK